MADQRQPLQQVKTVVLEPSELRSFRLAHPEAKMVGWPSCNSKPSRYVYHYTVQNEQESA